MDFEKAFRLGRGLPVDEENTQGAEGVAVNPSATPSAAQIGQDGDQVRQEQYQVDVDNEQTSEGEDATCLAPRAKRQKTTATPRKHRLVYSPVGDIPGDESFESQGVEATGWDEGNLLGDLPEMENYVPGFQEAQQADKGKSPVVDVVIPEVGVSSDASSEPWPLPDTWPVSSGSQVYGNVMLGHRVVQLLPTATDKAAFLSRYNGHSVVKSFASVQYDSMVGSKALLDHYKETFLKLKENMRILEARDMKVKKLKDDLQSSKQQYNAKELEAVSKDEELIMVKVQLATLEEAIKVSETDRVGLAQRNGELTHELVLKEASLFSLQSHYEALKKKFENFKDSEEAKKMITFEVNASVGMLFNNIFKVAKRMLVTARPNLEDQVDVILNEDLVLDVYKQILREKKAGPSVP